MSNFHGRNVVGLVNFIVILDSAGSRLYSRYYLPEGHELNNIVVQKEFEKKIVVTVNSFNVSKLNEGKFIN
jgi:hypothetical protein